MYMNAEMIFNEFAKYVESDDKYYTWGKHGVIEDALAWFNIPSENLSVHLPVYTQIILKNCIIS